MEDLGDLAGYEEGQVRSTRFGLNYLRLNRLRWNVSYYEPDSIKFQQF